MGAAPDWPGDIWRSAPLPNGVPGLGAHLEALSLSVGVPFALGLSGVALSLAVEPIWPNAAFYLAATGYYVAILALVSTLGQVPGVFVLRVLAQRQSCGWASVAIAGALVGLVVDVVIGLSQALWFAPPLALLHLHFLRRAITRKRDGHA
ncbi:MAG: hypothetical protein QNJ09_03220 [Paracoccaceae bacterium]|nr:hypothetical protein [Paracoccaceae bacterium]